MMNSNNVHTIRVIFASVFVIKTRTYIKSTMIINIHTACQYSCWRLYHAGCSN